MKGITGALCVAVLGSVALVCATSVTAASKPAGGPIQIFVKPAADNIHGPIVVTGAIGDYGQTTSMTKSGKPDPNGNFVAIKLQKGTFEVDSTVLNKKLNSAHGTVNKTTCSFAFSGTGPVTLFNGTGLYEGISGTVKVTVSFAGVGPVFKTGKNKGTCNFGDSAPTLASFSAITGNGAVKFG